MNIQLMAAVAALIAAIIAYEALDTEGEMTPVAPLVSEPGR